MINLSDSRTIITIETEGSRSESGFALGRERRERVHVRGIFESLVEHGGRLGLETADCWISFKIPLSALLAGLDLAVTNNLLFLTLRPMVASSPRHSP